MELTDKEFSMLVNALDKEFSRLARRPNGRDMFNNTADDYFDLVARITDARFSQLNREDNATT